MTITIAGISFDHQLYDARGDVLYLNVGRPQPAASGIETVDGHVLHYDKSGSVIGLTLLNVRRSLEENGDVTLTLPPMHLAPSTLEPVLAASKLQARMRASAG